MKKILAEYQRTDNYERGTELKKKRNRIFFLLANALILKVFSLVGKAICSQDDLEEMNAARYNVVVSMGVGNMCIKDEP
uniref:Uncharacterized protein n=1 Tax=Romanomermis culicivorax TaxID=13658 RepID=A0A915JZ74_ROMCU